MRHQLLTGYLLHQRPYQENRSLWIFFSEEVGIIHGVGKKNLPLFTPIQLFATGKNSLKTFSQSQPQITNIRLTGQGLYVGLYLNELLVKLLPVEENFVKIWHHYQQILQNIYPLFQPKTEDSLIWLKWYLRQFENLLLTELGYGVDFLHNHLNEPLQLTKYYQYQWQQGFVEWQYCPNDVVILTGEQILTWHGWLNNPQQFANIMSDSANFLIILQHMSQIYRQMIDNLLHHQPLKSRELWQQLISISK